MAVLNVYQITGEIVSIGGGGGGGGRNDPYIIKVFFTVHSMRPILYSNYLVGNKSILYHMVELCHWHLSSFLATFNTLHQ